MALTRATLKCLFSFSMNEPRAHPGGAHHPELGFLVSGGGHGYKSTEITTDGITFVDFTPIPIKIYAHCSVALDGRDDGEFFYAGGHEWAEDWGVQWGERGTERAYIHRANQWEEVTPMPTTRRCKKSNLARDHP